MYVSSNLHMEVRGRYVGDSRETATLRHGSAILLSCGNGSRADAMLQQTYLISEHTPGDDSRHACTTVTCLISTCYLCFNPHR